MSMYGRFYNLGLKFNPNYNSLLPVDYDVYVPTDYWRKDANLVPAAASQRVGQLELFYRLYQGDYRQFLPNQVVSMNYHKITTSFVGSLLMMYPPELIMPGDLPVSGRFVAQLHKSLRMVIADMVRYGTGLFRVEPGEYGAEIYAHSPVYWYPADADSDTLAIPGQGQVELWHDLGRGEVRYERWTTEGDGKGRALEELAQTETEQIGDEAQWQAIQSLTLGRAGLIINTPADLPMGDWGESIYHEITPLAIEITHRLTQNHAILDDHGNPMVLFIPDHDSPLTKVENFYGDGGNEDLEVKRILDFNNSWRERRVTNVPDGFSDAKYLQWEGKLEDHFNQIMKCEELLFAATRLPAAFFNIGPNGLPPSGVALQRQFLRTHAYVRDLIASLTDSIYRAVLVASMLNGASAQEIEMIYDNLEVEWRTIFDETETDSEDSAPDVNADQDAAQEEEMS